MKLTWLTDIHLNFLDVDERNQFYQDIVAAHCDSILITGDIAEASSLVGILKEMAGQINKPIYFVLGNHDYYKGKVSDVHEAVTALTKREALLFWLPAAGPQILKENVILLGQDGWADGRLGDYQNSRVSLNDSRMIADLFQEKMLGKFQLLTKMQQLSDLDARRLHDDLNRAMMQRPKKVIVLTHVPPFKEACLHEGEISNDDWLPYFSAKATGDVLMQVAKENLSTDFLVLCGHTHSESTYQPLDNLTVKAGQAEYGQPKIQGCMIAV